LVRKVKKGGSKPAYQWLGWQGLLKVLEEREHVKDVPIVSPNLGFLEDKEVVNSQFTQGDTLLYEESSKRLNNDEQGEGNEEQSYDK
jgi:hypothetical protein